MKITLLLVNLHITIVLIRKNNSSARSARAFDILIHFFAVDILTTGSLSKDDGYSNENVSPKCNLALSQVFRD